MRETAATLNPKAAPTLAAFDAAIALAERLDDPDFSKIAEPTGRLKVEILQQAVTRIRDAVVSDLGPSLGVQIGFNAADGD
jgi:uncharacterized protein